jgi:tRNA(Arg) A34 adenosine deaminase TadA
MSDAHWMELALEQARLASTQGDVPIGAVVVRDDELLASAPNARERDQDPTAHAEILALRGASRALASWRLEGCDVYVTLEPCPMCAGAMVLARVGRLIYGAANPEAGAAGSVVDLVRSSFLNHRVEVEGGVLADPCAALLKDFFQARR